MPPTQPAAPGTAPSPKNYPTQKITHAETEKPDGRCLRSWALDTEEVSNRQGDSRSGDWSQQGSGLPYDSVRTHHLSGGATCDWWPRYGERRSGIFLLLPAESEGLVQEAR